MTRSSPFNPPPKTAETGPREIDSPAAEAAVSALLRALGADTTSEALQETPRRVVASYRQFLTPEPFTPTSFANDSPFDGLVVVRHVEFHSLCMHHLLPFFGIANVGYIPGDVLIGASKIGRAVDYFARRLQMQERLTSQIADWLEHTVEAKGVGVVLVATHTCITLRGAAKAESELVTSSFRGKLLSDQSLRGEFLTHVRGESTMQDPDEPQSSPFNSGADVERTHG